MVDIFISYPRRDKTFVRQLADALAVQQRDIWVDREANASTNPPALAQRSLAATAYYPGTRRRFEGHEGWVSAVAYNPDRQMVLTG